MTPSDETLFSEALAKPPAERAAFLDQACAGDPERRARLESLLRAEERARNFIETVPASAERTALAQPHPEERPGDRIGRYKLLEKIGEGGCGIVYVAEQTEPVVRRVALKVIKLGMDTRDVIARFEAERQALALMDHPNIAKVLDAGSTATGRPYFVMELVRGVPLTRFCDEHNSSTAERLELFIQVCHAIQHAHQKGVIHRDIKPSNILVALHDTVAVPKVIDFGIAKATAGRLTDNTVYTAFEQFIGTPAYMSPEQAQLSALDIDTRSDIYSLGVLLYELLTGRTPFDAAELLKAGLDEMRRHIREVEPPRPSTRLSTLQGDALTATAQHRQIAPPKLINLIRGDLDWIVMRCLEKDRVRRYETANALADDLRRHLANEPVTASPPGAVYRLRKLARRHRLAFAAGAGIAAAVLVGAGVATWQAIRARRAEHVATMRAYASDINLAQQAIANQNFVRAAKIIRGLRPAPGQPDLRGWEWRFLWQQCRSDEIQTVHRTWGYGISSVALSSDGARIAFSKAIVGVDVVDTGTNKIVGHLWAGNWSEVAFSPTEPLLAAGGSKGDGRGGWRGNIKLWDTKSRRIVRELELGGACRHLAFSRDGRFLLAVHRRVEAKGPAQSDYLSVYDVSTGQPVGQLVPMAIGDDVPVYMGMSGPRTPVAANLEAGLAAHTLPRGFCVIDPTTGRRRWSQEADVFGGRATALALSPDGQVLAAAASGMVTLWDAATGRQVGRMAETSSRVSTLAFTPDGATLVSGHHDRLIRVWDTKQLSLVGTLNGHAFPITTIAVGANSRTVVSGGDWNGEVFLWDLRRAAHAPVHFSIQLSSWRGWGFNPEGRSVVTASEEEKKVKITRWSGRNFGERETLAEIPLESKEAVSKALQSIRIESPFEITTKRLVGQAGTMANLFSLLGSGFLETVFGGSLISVVQEKATQKVVAQLGAIPEFGERSYACVSFDGRRFAAYVDLITELKVYDVESGRELISFGQGLAGVRNLRFSPDGNCIGARTGDGLLHIWTAPSWAEIAAAEKADRTAAP